LLAVVHNVQTLERPAATRSGSRSQSTGQIKIVTSMGSKLAVFMMLKALPQQFPLSTTLSTYNSFCNLYAPQSRKFCCL
jgi:hypothetical protein